MRKQLIAFALFSLMSFEPFGPTTAGKDKEIAPLVGESVKFRAFNKEKLLPEISKKYRNNPLIFGSNN